MEQVIFYIFAAVLLFAGAMVITVRNPVHAALFLVLAFFNAAILWVLAGAEFLGIALVVIYVGAVMVLFLFVLMMLDINVAPLREGFARYLPVGALVAALMAAQLGGVILAEQAGLTGGMIPAPSGETNNIQVLGALLYTAYVYPFEIAGAILLVAIVAAIALTLRPVQRGRYQRIGEQLATSKRERLRIVKMKPRGGGAEQ
ncbi:NADH-quinone oxidoreductase subunit J [Halorhodospira neutriphila]|uniref:NADH-quinone oxidoreductase subunit J n=1 Tax=Halorhodospira neutriphila TaxID=168379 RepID=A0ABS1EA92_9GAMM|nr:NADH-quinone oxidoreductase subunit J [Halorhodospira neutriphila]MBK1727465.1 NADH:ubiquinone oxidoreductase subunit J [Halorhodospira neutriphila]